MPKQPPNDPVFLLDAIGVAAEIIYGLRLFARLLIYLEDLAVHGGLVDRHVSVISIG